MGGASGWLEWRGKHLGGREEVRRQLAEARSQLTHSRYIYLLTTVAMAIYPIIYTQWQNGALYCYGHCYAESLAKTQQMNTVISSPCAVYNDSV